MIDIEHHREEICDRAAEDLHNFACRENDSFLSQFLFGCFAEPMSDRGNIPYGGFKRGDLAIISGKSGCGKTLFALTLFSRAIAQGNPAVFATLEATETDVLFTLASMAEGIASSKLYSGFIKPSESESVVRAISRLRGDPAVCIVADRVPDDSELFERLADSAYEHKARVMFVDGLGLAKADSEGQNYCEAIASVVRHLKRTAMILGIPIIATLPESVVPAVDEWVDTVIELRTELSKFVRAADERYAYAVHHSKVVVSKNRVGPAPASIDMVFDFMLKRISIVPSDDSSESQNIAKSESAAEIEQRISESEAEELEKECATNSFSLELAANERILDLSGSPGRYVAIIESDSKEGSIKKDYWIVTADSREGSFALAPSLFGGRANAIKSSAFAIVEKEGEEFLYYESKAYGGVTNWKCARAPDRDEMTRVTDAMPSPGGPFQIMVSYDERRWAAVVKSAEKPGAYDIVTDRGMLDWFAQLPVLLGFSSDDKLVYRTMKYGASDNVLMGMSFYCEQKKLSSLDLIGEFSNQIIIDLIYADEKGRAFGWPEGKLNARADSVSLRYVVFRPEGKTTVMFDDAGKIERITPDGQIVSRGTIGQFLQGRRMIADSSFSLACVSPDGLRLAFACGDEIRVGTRIVRGDASHCFFSADSKHFIVDGTTDKSIDGVALSIPTSQEWSEFLEQTHSVSSFGHINRKSFQCIVVASGPSGACGYYAMGKLVRFEKPVGRISQPVISDDGSTVLFIDAQGGYYVNGVKSCDISGNGETAVLETVSSDGSVALISISNSSGLSEKVFLMNGKPAIGSFFGREASEPEGYTYYEDGKIMVRWPGR